MLIPNPPNLGGAFPNVDLEMIVEAGFGANVETPADWQWTDLSDRLLSNQINTSRGSSSGASESASESAALVLRNDDHALTPTHPMAEHYPYVVRNVPVRVLLHPGHGDVSETFTRAGTETNWNGVSVSGHTWSGFATGGPTNGISGGVGTHTISVAGTYSLKYTGAAENAEVRAQCQINKLAAGGAYEPTLILRLVSPDTFDGYYMVRYEIANADQKVTIKVICKPEGAGEFLVASVLTTVTHATATPLQLRARIVGSHLQAKVWQGSTEPAAWQLHTFDTTVTGVGAFGVRSGIAVGVSNTPVTYSYDNFQVMALYVAVAGYAADWKPTFLPERVGKSWSQITLTVSGVRRRLTRRDSPFHSPIRRAALYYLQRGELLAYWPLEDGPDAQSASNAVDDRRPMRPQGITPSFGSYDPPPPNTTTRRWGTAPVASFSEGGRLFGAVAPSTVSPVKWAARCLAAVNAAGAGSTVRILSVELAGGTHVRWELAAAFTGGVTLTAFDVDNNATVLIAAPDPTPIGLGQYQVDAVQSGTGVNIRLWYGSVLIPYAWVTTATTTTLGRIRQVIVNPYQLNTSGASTDLGRTFAVGHVQVWNSNDVGVDADSIIDPVTGGRVTVWEAWAGESAEGRMNRLCAAESVPVVTWSAGDAATATRLGAQDDEPLLDAVSDAALADGGLLSERNFCVTYKARSARYNQTPTMTVDLETYKVAQGDRENVLAPVYDDQDVRNDQEYTRPGGSAGRVSDEPHVAVHGRYADSTAINVQADAQLVDHAAWAVHMGTVDEMRHPQLKLDLAANPDLVDAWMATDIGSVVRRTNPPPEHPPGDVDLVVEGVSETFGPRLWQVTANCTPASPWHVAVLDDGVLGKADTDGSTLASGITSSATSMSVVSDPGPRWTTDPAEFPFDVNVDGERITVTAISGTGLTQTFSITRSVNGVTRAHSAGADVRLWQPMILAL